MGAVRMRVQIADKNITINPHQSSPSVNVLRNEKLSLCVNQIHFNYFFFFLLQTIASDCMSSIHNIAFSSENVILS